MKKKPSPKKAPARSREREEKPQRGRDRSPKRSGSGLEFESFKMKGHVYDELEITEVRVALLGDKDGAGRALASITLNDGFAVGGLKVVQDGRKGGGLFVSMPQRKDGEGEYHDTCFPLTKKGRETIAEAVLDAYDRAGGR